MIYKQFCGFVLDCGRGPADALAQRRQHVALGALPRKDNVLWPSMPALVHPLRPEVQRRNQAQVGRAARWPCTASIDVDCPSPALLIETTANNAHSLVHLWFHLQAFHAHARAV